MVLFLINPWHRVLTTTKRTCLNSYNEYCLQRASFRNYVTRSKRDKSRNFLTVRRRWSPNRVVARQGGRKAEIPLYFCYYDDDDVIQTEIVFFFCDILSFKFVSLLIGSVARVLPVFLSLILRIPHFSSLFRFRFVPSILFFFGSFGLNVQ